jgi:hypothetical protein
MAFLEQEEPAMHSYVFKALLGFGCFALLITTGSARWKQDYANVPAEERAWYERQTTTPETRARLQASWYLMCCDHSDTVNAKFLKTGDRWQYQEEGTSAWREIPQDIVQSDVMTPHGKGVLFVDVTGRNFGPVCFFPGGIGT